MGVIGLGEKSDAGRRIARGTIWSIIGTIITRSVTIGMSFVLARVLGADGFGEYGVINSTASTIGAFVGLGLGSTVTRYIATLRNTDRARIGKIVALSYSVAIISSIIQGGVFIVFSPWLAEHVLSAPHLTKMLQISSLTVTFGVLGSLQLAILAGLESFRSSALLSSFISIVQSILVVLLAYWYGVYGSVLGVSLVSILSFILLYNQSSKEFGSEGIKVSFGGLWNERSVLLNYSLPTFLGTITVGPLTWAANALLANQPGGYTQLGIYNAALQWEVLMKYVPTLIASTSLPVMSDLLGRGFVRDGEVLLLSLLRTMLILLIPLAIIVSLLSDVIIGFYGPGFGGGQSVLVVVVISSVFASVSSTIGIYINALGKMWIAFAINSIWGITFITSSYYFISDGALGLAKAKIVAYGLHLLWSFFVVYLIRKEYDVRS